MSDRYDRLVAALDSEWRPTIELKKRARIEEHVRMSSVYHSLNMAVKYRMAEKRVVIVGKGARVAEWRRVA